MNCLRAFTMLSLLASFVPLAYAQDPLCKDSFACAELAVKMSHDLEKTTNDRLADMEARISMLSDNILKMNIDEKIGSLEAKIDARLRKFAGASGVVIFKGDWTIAKNNNHTKIFDTVVDLPQEKFSSPPMVFVSIIGIEISSGNIDLYARPDSISKNAFHIVIYGDDNMRFGNFAVQWLALDTAFVQVLQSPKGIFVD